MNNLKTDNQRNSYINHNPCSLIRGCKLLLLVSLLAGFAPRTKAICIDACLTAANTAQGENVLFSLTTGSANTGVGANAMYYDTMGSNNVAMGVEALINNATGNTNTAIGNLTLNLNLAGNDNTAVGYGALVGNSGNSNIGVGSNAGGNLTNGTGNIDIGNTGATGESNTIRIGTQGTQTGTYVAGVFQAPIGSGQVVRVNSQGKLGTIMSSARFKEAIKPMGQTSESILQLKPVTFRYKREIDSTKQPQFGLVAEQVEKVDRQLVEYDSQGKPYTVRYEAVNAMLLNEFLKEHHTVQDQAQKLAAENQKVVELRSEVSDQRKTIAALAASLREQAKQIQKVSDQLAATPIAPRLVANGASER